MLVGEDCGRERRLERVDEKKKVGTNKCVVNENAIFVKRVCMLEMKTGLEHLRL